MKIHLQDGYEPKRVLTARQTPVHLREGAEETLNAAIKSGVIVPVSEPTEWISPAFFVAKATPGKARLVTDYTALNRFVTRPVHPFPSPVDVMRLIKPESKVFAKLDAYSGYFQIPLEPESSLMTTFILPSGKYRYTRAPMGLNASSDEFCRRTDEALAGVDGVVKVVDDILVQAEDYDQLEERLEQVLERCRAARITLTKGKFYVGEEVKFAGFIITGSGIKPDPGKIRAISDFPAPTNISALRSFLGLANQLGMFHSGLAAATNDLRWLLKKDVAWSWTPEIHNAFLRVKELLSSEACVRPFQTNRLAELITDASSIHGLGFALMQDGFLIQAGSRSLIDAETRYAVVELEATAVAWAIKQCRHYLLGCRNFKVWTDHRPLVGIFKKDMASVDSRRLNRIRESLLGYNFEVEYLAGKDNVIADALSRFPVSAVTAEDVPEDDDDEFVDDPAIKAFAAATAADKDLQAVIGVLKARCPPSNLPPQHPARPYASVLDELSISSAGILVLRGTRIVVPKTLRPQVVRALHAGHAGITKTLLHARQRYSWPYMANDIKTVIDACEACQEHRQGPHFEPEVKRVASYPMEAVSVDLMEVKGTKYLVMVDRFSSYPLVKVVRTATTSSIVKILASWFHEFGWPKSIGSDGGPQFKEQFKEFCTSKKIVHELSSVRNPQSNGLAEAGVKRIKYLMEKCRNKEEFEAALFAFRNAPMADGRPAPAVAFHGRELRDPDLPTVPPAALSPAALSSAPVPRPVPRPVLPRRQRRLQEEENRSGSTRSTKSASSIRTQEGGTTPAPWCGPEPATNLSSS
jgi:transposase InsO family protein